MKQFLFSGIWIISMKLYKLTNKPVIVVYPFVLIPSKYIKISNSNSNYARIRLSQQFEMILISLTVTLSLSLILHSWFMILPLFVTPFLELSIRCAVSLGLLFHNPFQREAFLKCNQQNYLKNRRAYAWVVYLIHQSK